jgi:hypothetical protein
VADHVGAVAEVGRLDDPYVEGGHRRQRSTG